MDLKSKLQKFNKQNERINQTLQDLAIRPGATGSSSKKKSAAPPAAPKPPPPAGTNIASLTFANDKDKLQMIAQVRRAPVMSQVKKVIDILKEHREAFTPDDINRLCFVDVANNKEVFENLKSNLKVSFDGTRFSYKATHQIENKEELLVFVRKNAEGVPMSDLKDAYPGIVQDAHELKKTGDIRIICNTESQEEVLYPDDPKTKIKVDDDVQKLIRGIPLPNEFVTIERDLIKAGIRPMTNSAERRERVSVPVNQQKQKKKKKSSKRTKYTNAHLPELFQQLPAHMK